MRSPFVLGPALLALAGCASSEVRPTPAAEVLPFIEDDYPRALALAKAQHKPLFVDVWAPWCHSCRFMRANVFTDPALAPQAGKFIWLALNTDTDSSAAFTSRLHVDALPTLFVLDPDTEAPVMRWLGSANREDLQQVLDDARATLAAPQDASGPLAQADAAEGAGKHAEAIALYKQALDHSGQTATAQRAAVSLQGAMQLSGDLEGCVRLGRARAGTATTVTAHLAYVATGLQCGLGADEKAAWRGEAIGALESDALKLLGDPTLNADDRAGLYQVLVDARKDAKDESGASDLAQAWLAFMEKALAAAPTADAWLAIDPNLVTAALAAKHPERAVAPLQRSEAERPDDYNAPARLAVLYQAQQQYDLALAASDRALKHVQGPRRIRVLEQRAAIEKDAGKPAEARLAVQQAIAAAQALPAGATSPKTVERLQRQLDAMPQ
jgi:thiol-disulfide isomerase/thioredoxin